MNGGIRSAGAARTSVRVREDHDGGFGRGHDLTGLESGFGRGPRPGTRTATSVAGRSAGSGRRLRSQVGSDGFGKRLRPQPTPGTRTATSVAGRVRRIWTAASAARSDPTGRKAASAALRIRDRSTTSVGGRFEGSVRRLRSQDRSDGSGKRLRSRTTARGLDGGFGRRVGSAGPGRRLRPQVGSVGSEGGFGRTPHPEPGRRLRPRSGSKDRFGGFGRSSGPGIGKAASAAVAVPRSEARLHRCGSDRDRKRGFTAAGQVLRVKS
jgi:hypothetical protein